MGSREYAKLSTTMEPWHEPESRWMGGQASRPAQLDGTCIREVDEAELAALVNNNLIALWSLDTPWASSYRDYLYEG